MIWTTCPRADRPAAFSYGERDALLHGDRRDQLDVE
jgi:hypothetical protein